MTESQSTANQEAGLAEWIDQVLEEHSKAGGALHADPVHDLRVSLRRCLLIADVMKEVDPGSEWKAMRKSARQTFQRLGGLRDTQVLMDWVSKLGSTEDPSTQSLLEILKKKYEQDRTDAREAVREFDRKQWRAWRRDLPKHYRHVLANRPACQSLVLEIWENAFELNRRGQRSRSLLAYHRLRVGLKKFRYAVENFLPSLYEAWAPDLKLLQDLLGEVHDLTVLDQLIVKNRALFEDPVLLAWRKKVADERGLRLEQYRARMGGKNSLLRNWREVLPPEKDLRSTGLARLAEWGSFLTPDFRRARRIARLSLQLYDGLTNCGMIERNSPMDERFILHAAALLQEVGRFERAKAYHKESYRMIRKISPPPGWTKKDLELAALVTRFHRRALPYPDHEKLRVYELPLRQALVRLAAILRVANGFQSKQYRATRRLQVENGPGFLVIRAEGFRDRDAVSTKLSEARRFLEFAFQRSVHILAPGTRMMIPRLVRQPARIDAA